MSRLLPFKSETTRQPDGTTVLSLEDEATHEALSALSSDTAREILSLGYEEPMTARTGLPASLRLRARGQWSRRAVASSPI